jgi:acyl carrier protein
MILRGNEMTANKIALQLQEQIIELVSVAAGPNLREPLTAQAEILESKLVDSFGLLQLIVDIEQKFNINIPTEDMTLENFSTISAMVDLISRYQDKS